MSPGFRILITGSRNWDDQAAIAHAIGEVWPPHCSADEITLVHGGATGADHHASGVALAFGVACEEHPADWTRGHRAGPERNQAMVDAGADVCLAFPLPGSRGTWDCVKRANAAGIPVRIIAAARS